MWETEACHRDGGPEPAGSDRDVSIVAGVDAGPSGTPSTRPRLGPNAERRLHRQPVAALHGNESAWRHVGWHEIEHGGWNSETHKPAGPRTRAREFIELAEPVECRNSFVSGVGQHCRRTLRADRGGAGVTVSGPAGISLDTSAVITWHQTLGRGLSWNSGEVRTVADAAWPSCRRNTACSERLVRYVAVFTILVAQLAEHSTVNRGVVGSSPTGGAATR